MANVTRPYFDINQLSRKFILTSLPAGVLADITYTAVRGVDSEPGAVQRVLTTRRVASVAEFVLEGGDFPGSIVLNWQDKLKKLKDKKLHFNTKENLAQIIDGQHRVAGLKEAIKTRNDIRKLEIPVVIYENLPDQQCADIFLSINTEQKSVARSLVYDLYGISSELTSDPAIVRARDIAEHLNENQESPYWDLIKFPGDKRRRGGIALSSAVSAIKALVSVNGSFEQVGVKELEVQITCLINFFSAIESIYKDQWNERTNVFQYSAGFTAACLFLQLEVVPYCKNKGSFEKKVIKKAILLKKEGLILQDEVKGQSGGEAVKIVYKRLQDAFSPDTRTSPSLKF
jgi:DGQHR domain-containing protein